MKRSDYQLELASLLGFIHGTGMGIEDFIPTPSPKEKINRTSDDIDERKAKQLAKLARRAKHNT